MLYHNFRALNWIFTIFGLRKPFDETSTISWPYTLWSIVLIVCFVSYNTYRVLAYRALSLWKYDLGLMSMVNVIAVNATCVLADLLLKQRHAPELYRCITRIVKELGVGCKSIRRFTLKMYFWFAVPLLLTFIVILAEITRAVFHVILTKMCMMIALMHLQIHLYIIVGILKKLNEKLSKKLKPRDKYNLFVATCNNTARDNSIWYFLCNNIYFVENDQPDMTTKLKSLCNIYDDLSYCIKLLEKLHGLQVLLDIWMSFTSGIAMITALTTKDISIEDKIFSIMRACVPFFWHLIMTNFDDQIQQEVATTDTLIMKHIIDYHCDETERNILQSFKQLVSTHRLRFKACSLFHIDYAMVVRNIVSIITYSIILIQLFFSE